MTTSARFRELVTFALGGGWGSAVPLAGHERVAVIRGADFAAVAAGRAAGVPRRWERAEKLARRVLRPGDIIMEISGGSGNG